MKIWTGKLKLKGEPKRGGHETEGDEVDARIIVSASVTFEVSTQLDALNKPVWRPAAAGEIYGPSWLRALGETGKAVP